MASQYTLNVSVTEHLRSFVDEQVASGRFSTASEVVRAALRALQQDLSRVAAPSADRPSGTTAAVGRIRGSRAPVSGRG